MRWPLIWDRDISPQLKNCMPQLQLLTAVERAEFESPPVFSRAERHRYFQVSPSLDALLATLRTPTNQIYFLLRLGYFRAMLR